MNPSLPITLPVCSFTTSPFQIHVLFCDDGGGGDRDDDDDDDVVVCVCVSHICYMLSYMCVLYSVYMYICE